MAICCWMLYLLPQMVCAQLPAFTLTITPTAETCPGNATLTFAASGNDPAANMTYAIYLLPNTTTPVAVLNNSSFQSGLISGTYYIVATQSLGAQNNSVQQNVTVTNEIVPLSTEIRVNGTPVTCGNNGTMTVNVLSGHPVSYEIISGPQLAPPQASNVFTGLQAGLYQIKVTDNCGQARVVTHQLFPQASEGLTWAETDPSTLANCNEIVITNTLSPKLNNAISFPVTIVYTVFPPNGGAPQVTTTNMASGDISGQEFVITMPYYDNLVYSYSVTVTDACGTGYYFENIQINKPFTGEFRSPKAECGELFLSFALDTYMAPMTVTFLDAPAGFNPSDYNINHPGPFGGPTIDYGNNTNGVPFGHYKAVVTDACGRTVTLENTLEPIPFDATVDFEPGAGCDSDKSKVTVKSDGYVFIIATVISGPPSYSATYPVDVSGFITPMGTVEIPIMPTGDYVMELEDSCGNHCTEPFTVPPLNTMVSALVRPGCELGKGSIRLRGNQVDLQIVRLIQAPTTYPGTLPEDLSFNISPDFRDTFSMNGFDSGSYVFEVLDSCGAWHEVTAEVIGYEITQNDYDITKHCGAFDLAIDHSSNGQVETYWLQTLDPVSGNWEHPDTGVAYVPGSMLNATNAYQLINHTTNFNIGYMGQFRVLKRFESFENGGAGLFKFCVEEIQNFIYSDDLHITNIQKVTCDGVRSDVSVTADGVPPLNYRITAPYFLDNGNNPVFSQLQPAMYTFEVWDSCGNVASAMTDVAQLPSLVQLHQPGTVVSCAVQNGNSAIFDLTQQNSVVLNGADASLYTITYYATAAEAATGSNPFPMPESYQTVSRDIFVRLQYNAVPSCFDVASFPLVVNPAPVLSMPLEYAICDAGSISITADAGYEGYLWSTGATTNQITVSAPGVYTLELTHTQTGLTCHFQYTVTVVNSEAAQVLSIETEDWTYDQNTIRINLQNPLSGDYTYSLDNDHFQSSPVFYGLAPGIYTVYIQDENGCDSSSHEVHLLAYPKFFTPNQDGYNDFWQVFYAYTEPALQVAIFDRYGKLLSVFGADSPGWDGRYNGRELPSTDYWFVVTRQDGTQHRGHFAMKR